MRLISPLAALTLLLTSIAPAQQSPDLVPPPPEEQIATPEDAVESPASQLSVRVAWSLP